MNLDPLTCDDGVLARAYQDLLAMFKDEHEARQEAEGYLGRIAVAAKIGLNEPPSDVARICQQLLGDSPLTSSMLSLAAKFLEEYACRLGPGVPWKWPGWFPMGERAPMLKLMRYVHTAGRNPLEEQEVDPMDLEFGPGAHRVAVFLGKLLLGRPVRMPDPLATLATAGIKAVAAEHLKQKQKWGTSHDEAHEQENPGMLLRAAHYLMMPVQPSPNCGEPPWVRDLFRKYPDHRKRLVIAAAMIASQIDVMDREKAAAMPVPSTRNPAA